MATIGDILYQTHVVVPGKAGLGRQRPRKEAATNEPESQQEPELPLP